MKINIVLSMFFAIMAGIGTGLMINVLTNKVYSDDKYTKYCTEMIENELTFENRMFCIEEYYKKHQNNGQTIL